MSVPEGAVLSLSYGVETPRRTPRARVDFRVQVLNEGRVVTVLDDRVLVDRANLWHDAKIDLAAWSGKTVVLALETRPTHTRGPVPSADRIRTVWAEPVLEVRPKPEVPARASVIVIVVDTLRYDFLGAHGFRAEISPNLDWLAAESTIFDRAFSAAPWTKPAVASLLTGLYPTTHGVLDHRESILPGTATDVLADEAVTLAEVFRGEGYDTAAFVANPWLGEDYGFAQGFDTYTRGRDAEVMKRALEFIQTRRDDAPYFVYLHVMGPHGPYRGTKRDYETLRDSPSLGPERPLQPSDAAMPRHLRSTPFADEADADDLASWKAKYAAAVRGLDRELGEWLGALRTGGELDRAWVVFTSDHGEEFLEHGQWEHGYSLCEHQLHVPLWIRRPGARGAGRRTDGILGLTDVMPTILGMTGIPVPDDTYGSDRSAWLEPDAKPSRRVVSFATGRKGRPGLHTLRTDQHRLIWDETTDSA